MPNFIDERVWDLLASLTNRINQKRMNEKPLTHEELRLIMQHINGKDKITGSTTIMEDLSEYVELQHY